MLELLLAASEAAEGGEAHATPSALGLDPTGWVALAMIILYAV